MPSREERAADNLTRAMRDAGAQFELKRLTRETEGYAATFQMGMVTHVESAIDAPILEDGPPSPALGLLVEKVRATFEGMT